MIIVAFTVKRTLDVMAAAECWRQSATKLSGARRFKSLRSERVRLLPIITFLNRRVKMDKFVIVNICNPVDSEILKTIINLSHI